MKLPSLNLLLKLKELVEIPRLNYKLSMQKQQTKAIYKDKIKHSSKIKEKSELDPKTNKCCQHQCRLTGIKTSRIQPGLCIVQLLDMS